MPIFAGTLARYFGMRFLGAVLLVFAGFSLLIALLDYIELMRRAADIPNVSALLVAKTSLYRMPQVAERLMPFCVLIGAMSCYLNLSRRLELVIARTSGVSAWQFIAPALIVAFAHRHRRHHALQPGRRRLAGAVEALRGRAVRPDQARIRRQRRPVLGKPARRERIGHHQRQIEPRPGRGTQRRDRSSPSITTERFKQRIEARAAVLHPGVWHLLDARVFELGTKPVDQPVYRLKTSLTPEQARESFATPETVPFWELPAYITIAEHAGLVAAGYRLQFQKLIARPFLLVAMVFLAAAVSLRFFRFGGVQKMVLSGVAAGFLLYVLSKVTEDLSKADLLHPVAAAWLPVLVGGLTGFIALLYQEDG